MSTADVPRRRALLSVSDKTGLDAFARALAGHGFELVSTGGTAAALRRAGLAVTDVASVTGFPEIMDGRVKTLHPAVHGGLLGRPGQDDAVMREQGITRIDLLVVNLYPFRETVARPGCTVDEAIEQIDVGGPAMLRAAAKNHRAVMVVTDPGRYPEVLEALAGGDWEAPELRARLALEAFAHTSAYDAAIHQWLQTRLLQQNAAPEALPERLDLAFQRRQVLRYGENPHQQAAVYVPAGAPGTGLVQARQLSGKALSFNNLADADAALQCVNALSEPGCVIVKHGNPCGVALADSPIDAYQRAFACDPTSAFGGIIAFNGSLDAATVERILANQFVEVIVAHAVAGDALDVLARKPAVRVLAVPPEAGTGPALDLRPVGGGLLVQTADPGDPDAGALRVVTRRQPDAATLRDLQFLWTVARFVKSNAIVIGRDRATIGIGAGQMSRVWSTRIACGKAVEAGLEPEGAALASDAFFPFRDGVDQAAEAGIRAIIQPGGSMRDEEVIAAADEHGLAMVFTGVRHFRH